MVRWGEKLSKPYCLTAWIRQGEALSPCLFALFINVLIMKVIASGKCCHLELTGAKIILYADDIRLLAPSITALQSLLSACEDGLLRLYMMIN